MALDQTAIAYGFVGLAAGAGVHFWGRKAVLEQRCEFLAEMGQDLRETFDSVGDLLEDKSTPKPIRAAILVLLAGHSDSDRGRKMALSFMQAKRRKNGDDLKDGADPISQSMENLARYNPALARKTHHVLASLIFGLVFLNLADNIKVEKVKDDAAKDPSTLWARISKVFIPGNDHDHHDGGLVHA